MHTNKSALEVHQSRKRVVDKMNTVASRTVWPFPCLQNHAWEKSKEVFLSLKGIMTYGWTFKVISGENPYAKFHGNNSYKENL